MQPLASLFLSQPCQPRQRSIKGLSLDGSGNHTVGRHNRCSRCSRWRRCSCRNRANRGRDQSRVCHSTAPGTIRWGGTIGVPAATAGVVVLVATVPTAAEINQGSVTRRLREPYGGAAQSVFPLQPLASLLLSQPRQPRQRSIKGLSLDGSGNRTLGRHNPCYRCNRWRRWSCRNRTNRGRDQLRVCPSTAPGTVRWGGTIGVPDAAAGVVALVATAPTAAEINQGSVTRRLREPYRCWKSAFRSDWN
jgi:hypothetical protein